MTLTNTIRAGGFIESEANGFRSRDQVTLLGGSGGAGVLVAGTVLGKITSGGKYYPASPLAGDGSQTAVAILFDDVDSTAGDVIVSIIARDAEVRAADLSYDPAVDTLGKKQTKWAELALVDIIVRS